MEAKKHAEDAPNGYTPGLMFKRIRARISDITNYYEEPVFDKLLPDPLPAEFQAPYTLVLGLEDLLIHTEWDKTHGWRSAKRPGLDYFLGYLSMYYELVVFSDSPSHLVIPIAEKMGRYPGFITQFLSREATRYKDGKYIKVCIPSSRITNIAIADDACIGSLPPQPQPLQSHHDRHQKGSRRNATHECNHHPTLEGRSQRP